MRPGTREKFPHDRLREIATGGKAEAESGGRAEPKSGGKTEAKGGGKSEASGGKASGPHRPRSERGR